MTASQHIWANHPEQHTDDFAHEADFSRHRNRIGDLLLLPKQFNFRQNLLAASLNPLSYEKNPGFISFIKSSGLPFKPYEDFRAEAIIERGDLYHGIAKKVWDPDDLLTVAEDGD